LSEHPQLPPELQRQVSSIVTQTQQRSGWPVRRTLQALGVPPASYYRWRRQAPPAAAPPRASARRSYYEVLPAERQAIVDYALAHPEIRHRELAWRMLDDGVVAVSASTVYRVLQEANLVCRWPGKTRVKSRNRPLPPTRADELWQTDIRYTKVGARNYYLLSFVDVYSRYVVYHELLRTMDGLTVSIAATAALETLPPGVRPTIQSDNGSGFVAQEFAGALAGAGVTHTLIRPHTPTDNAVVERCQRTLGEKIDEHELTSWDQACQVIAEIIRYYNDERLHSSLKFLRPVDYYRGDPEALLAERHRKLTQARELRKQENLKLRQRLMPWTGPETLLSARGRAVSL
jgi:transposase InsO family protein